MNAKKTMRSLVVAALVVATVAATARAGQGVRNRQGPGGARPPEGVPGPQAGRAGLNRPSGPGNPVAAIQQALDSLDLTQEQRGQIREVLKANRDGLDKARDAHRAAMQAFASAVEKGDEAGIRAAGGQVGNAMADLDVLQTQAAAAIKKVLTDEQVQRLATIRQGARQARLQNPGLRARQGQGQGQGQGGVRGGLGPGPRGRIDPEMGPGPVPRNAGPRQGQALPPQRRGQVGRNPQQPGPGAFQRMDRNGDGVVSQQEFNAFQRQQGRVGPVL